MVDRANAALLTAVADPMMEIGSISLVSLFLKVLSKANSSRSRAMWETNVPHICLIKGADCSTIIVSAHL